MAVTVDSFFTFGWFILQVTNDAFGIMGMTPEEIKDVWRIVSAVSLMGNIETAEQRRGGEQAVIQDDSGELQSQSVRRHESAQVLQAVY